ncbi:MAG: hypothetical protein JW751_30475 [Polyangiaceae bacterium]|nr:hypothetical protein [Polyangiaceae bacterium]
MGGQWAGAALVGASLAMATGALAQTWEGGRTTPSLDEALVVDRTGETTWPFGEEDVAGDGGTFSDDEASVDVRSVYVTRGDAALWVRLYVSSDSEPGAELVAYLFLDADRDAGTGGPAVAEEVDPALTGDPSPGGYEYLIVVPVAPRPAAVWEWSGAAWTEGGVAPDAIAPEAGVDLDPILFGVRQHGYLQAAIDYGTAGLDADCDANLFFRTTATGAVASDGDLAIGELVLCAPRDANQNRVPDVVEPADCDRDEDCPGDGICVDGDCWIPVGCREPADCEPDETCRNGVCVREGGDACNDDADCAPLICDGGTCRPCSTDADCDGGRCAPDGTCVAEDSPPAGTGGRTGATGDAGAPSLTLDEEDEVRGGACTCTLPGRSAPSSAAWAALGVLAGLYLRRRR